MKKPRHTLKLPQPRPAKIQPANQMIWGNGKIKHHVTTERRPISLTSSGFFGRLSLSK